MKIKLLTVTLCVLIILTLTACTKQTPTPDVDVGKDITVTLPPSADRGMSYIDSFIFIGESTTYHLKSRAVLTGGKDTKQVWAPESGTINLDLSIDSLKIVYPETGKLLTFSEAATVKKPEYVVMTFGLNGAVQNIKKGEEYYKECYKKLINSVRTASPDTKIILQSAFPVAGNMDLSSYSVDLATLNRYIDTINGWTLSLAEEEGCRYLNTQEILKDENNNLKTEYQSGDGYHLTAEAYRQILYYIRTHSYA